MRKPQTILIIDDNRDDILIAKRVILKFRQEIIVEEAYDCIQALRYLKSEQPPALIILDLKLQETAGIEILQYIKNSESTNFIPVIILSTSNQDNELRSAYNEGASSFLQKTHDYHEFAELMNATLHYWLDLNQSPY